MSRWRGRRVSSCSLKSSSERGSTVADERVGINGATLSSLSCTTAGSSENSPKAVVDFSGGSEGVTEKREPA